MANGFDSRTPPNPMDDSEDATVTVTNVAPVISVVKTAIVPEPGAEVTFTVEVTNDSVRSDPVTITSLIDDIHGDLNSQGTCSVPQTIEAGASYNCFFTDIISCNADDRMTNISTASGPVPVLRLRLTR